MDFDAYLNSIKKGFGKTFKAEAVNLDLNTVDKELPPTGIVLDNPLLEYAFDRRFMAYGRCYLLYGKKGCAKTSLLFDLSRLRMLLTSGTWSFKELILPGSFIITLNR
jgi:hypothetical protein